MLPFVAGLQKKLNDVISKLNSDLDTQVSTRAPSSTALSTSNWTNARAAKLDNLDSLDATVSSRLSTAIASVQTGSVFDALMTETETSAIDSTYFDVTISSVNTAKSQIIWVASCNSSAPKDQIARSGSITSYDVYAKLLNSTTLRFFTPYYYAGGGRVYMTGHWRVVEFE